MRKLYRLTALLVASWGICSVAMAVDTVSSAQSYNNNWKTEYKELCDNKAGPQGACKTDKSSKDCVCRRIDAAINCKNNIANNCGNETKELKEACSAYNAPIKNCADLKKQGNTQLYNKRNCSKYESMRTCNGL